MLNNFLIKNSNIPMHYTSHISNTNIELSTGYSITKVDDDSYTFVVNTDTAAVGNKSGGGGLSSAGPVTLTP